LDSSDCRDFIGKEVIMKPKSDKQKAVAVKRPGSERHLRGEHNLWCSYRQGSAIMCKTTGKTIKQVGA
jgi:hypothetical protein